MHSWYRLTLDEIEETALFQSRLLAHGSIETAQGAGNDAAVFFRWHPAEGVFQFYFSPSAVPVFRTFLEEYGGLPSAPPPPPLMPIGTPTLLLWGSVQAIDKLFPDPARMQVLIPKERE